MYGPAKKVMRLWAHFLPRLVQGFSRASLETRWKMSPSSFAAIASFAAITVRARQEKKKDQICLHEAMAVIAVCAGLSSARQGNQFRFGWRCLRQLP